VTTDRSAERELALRHALHDARTPDGTTLAALSHEGPVLLVFLRHFG
jgi:hypothetical protein